MAYPSSKNRDLRVISADKNESKTVPVRSDWLLSARFGPNQTIRPVDVGSPRSRRADLGTPVFAVPSTSELSSTGRQTADARRCGPPRRVQPGARRAMFCAGFQPAFAIAAGASDA